MTENKGNAKKEELMEGNWGQTRCFVYHFTCGKMSNRVVHVKDKTTTVVSVLFSQKDSRINVWAKWQTHFTQGII